MKTIWKILVFVLVLGCLAAANLLVHEFAHCFTMNAVGGRCEGIYMMPGIKIWPLTALGQPYAHAWDNYIGLTVYVQGAPTEQANGLVSWMGSGSLAILSLLALIGLYTFQPSGWVQLPLLAEALMFPDLLFYTILPHWFGLRHMFFIGGNTPEPLNGALAMGISEWTFIMAVLLYSVLMLVGCVGYVWKRAKRRA